MADVVYIAKCPTHGFQGMQSPCIARCGQPVEQVAMISVEEHETAKREWAEANRLLVAELARLRVVEQAAREVVDAFSEGRAVAVPDEEPFPALDALEAALDGER